MIFFLIIIAITIIVGIVIACFHSDDLGECLFTLILIGVIVFIFVGDALYCRVKAEGVKDYLNGECKEVVILKTEDDKIYRMKLNYDLE